MSENTVELPRYGPGHYELLDFNTREIFRIGLWDDCLRKFVELLAIDGYANRPTMYVIEYTYSSGRVVVLCKLETLGDY